MEILKNKACGHCGEPNRNVFGFGDFSLYCCLECEVNLSRSALPYYELLDNEEMEMSKMNTVRTSLVGKLLDLH